MLIYVFMGVVSSLVHIVYSLVLTSTVDALSYLTQAKKLLKYGAEHANCVRFGLKDGVDTTEALSLADRLKMNTGVADAKKDIQTIPAMGTGRGRGQKKGFFCRYTYCNFH